MKWNIAVGRAVLLNFTVSSKIESKEAKISV